MFNGNWISGVGKEWKNGKRMIRKNTPMKTGKKDGGNKMALNERIQKARLKLMQENFFIGEVASRVQIIENNDMDGIIGTDGEKIYYNANNLDRLTEKGLIFYLGDMIAQLVEINRFKKRGVSKWS